MKKLTRLEFEEAKLALLDAQRKLDKERTISQVELNKAWDKLMEMEPKELGD